MADGDGEEDRGQTAKQASLPDRRVLGVILRAKDTRRRVECAG